MKFSEIIVEAAKYIFDIKNKDGVIKAEIEVRPNEYAFYDIVGIRKCKSEYRLILKETE